MWCAHKGVVRIADMQCMTSQGRALLKTEHTSENLFEILDSRGFSSTETFATIGAHCCGFTA